MVSDRATAVFQGMGAADRSVFASRYGMNGRTYLRWAAPFVMALLVLAPRVQILAVFQTGIRFDDGFLLLLLPGVLRRWADLPTSLRRTGIGLVTLTSLVSALIATMAGHVTAVSSMLFAVRVSEYWIIFPALLIGGCANRAQFIVRFSKILRAATVLQVGIAGLQVILGINIGFSKFSYVRGAGLTAGPYELGAICAALACFWYGQRRYTLFLVAVVGVLISSSRASLAAVVIVILWMAIANRRTGRSRAPNESVIKKYPAVVVVVVTAVFALAVGTLPLWQASLIGPIQARAADTSLLATWTEAHQMVTGMLPIETSAEYAQIAYTDIGQNVLNGQNGLNDQSSLVRFYRWNLLLKSMTARGSWIMGLGPSFAGLSVDGGLLRIFVETGLAGILSWILFFRRVVRFSSIWLSGAMLTLLIGAAFIDIQFAMRPMIVIWSLLAFDRIVRDRSALPSLSKTNPGNSALTEGHRANGGSL